MIERRRTGSRPVPAENQNEITREFSPQEQEVLRTVDKIRQRSGPLVAQRALEVFMTDLNEQEIARQKEAARELVAAVRATPKEHRPVPINFETPAEAHQPPEGANVSTNTIRETVRIQHHK